MRPNVLDNAFSHLSAVPHKQVRVCMNACAVQGDTVICKENHNHNVVSYICKSSYILLKVFCIKVSHL